MQSSTTMKLIIILAVFALSLYLLYPTYKLSQMTDIEEKSLEREDRNDSIEKDGDPAGNVLVRTTGTDYSSLVYNKA